MISGTLSTAVFDCSCCSWQHRAEGTLGSCSAKQGDGRQQLDMILFLKWGRAIVKLSRTLDIYQTSVPQP